MRWSALTALCLVLLLLQGCGGNATPLPLTPGQPPVSSQSFFVDGSTQYLDEMWVALAPTYVTGKGGATRQCTVVSISKDGKSYQEIPNPKSCGRCLIDDPNFPLQLDPQLWEIGGKFWSSYTVHTRAASNIGLNHVPQYTGVKWGMSWSDDLVNWHWGAVDMTDFVKQLGYDPKSPDTVVGAPGFTFTPNCATGDPDNDFKCITTSVFVGPNYDEGLYSLTMYTAHPVDGNFNTASYPAFSWQPVIYPPNDRGHGPTDTYGMFFEGKWYMMTAPDGYWETPDLATPWVWKGYLKTLDGSHLPQDTCSGGTVILPADNLGNWSYTCTDLQNPQMIDQYTASNNDIFNGWVYQGQMPNLKQSGYNGFFVMKRQEKQLIKTLTDLAANSTCSARSSAAGK